MDVPKAAIMDAVRAQVRNGGSRVALATEDAFIWGQVRTGAPFFFPNREALVDLCAEIASTPGIDVVALTHCTLAPFVVDPGLIAQLSALLLPKSPYRLPRSRHPEKRVLIPLIGLETASVRLAKQIMPGKGLPFPIDDWPSVVLEGLRIANENHWFPMLTLMVGSPDETDEDVKMTLDLVYEIERRGLLAFLIPSIFTPLPETRMESAKGVGESRELTTLQWQLLLKCWKFNLQPGQYVSWMPAAWKIGAPLLWATRLRRLNGPNCTWPMVMFSGLIPERLLQKYHKIYAGKPVSTKSREDLIAAVRPNYLPYFRADIGNVPAAEVGVANNTSGIRKTWRASPACRGIPGAAAPTANHRTPGGTVTVTAATRLQERTIPFTAGDGFQLNLINIRGDTEPVKGPVLMLHGAGVSANIFRPPNQRTLVDALVDAGYDVWLENWRGSVDFPQTQWTLDQTAVFDHPAAVKRIVEETGRDRIKAMVHCQGSTGFFMGLVAGLMPQVTTVVSNAVSLHPVIPTLSMFKMQCVRLFSYMSDYMNPQWGLQRPPCRRK